MPPRQEHLTKTEIALREVRDRIRTGAYEPGRRLGVDELTKDLGMSPTPIREALRLLQADQLISYRPHHGMIVAEVSTDLVDEISTLRAELEPLATRLAVVRMTPEAHAQLQRNQDDFTKKRNTREQRSRADADWHWTIYEASGSRFLEGFIQRLWDAFPWRAAHVSARRVEESVRQHEQVMEAIGAGDADNAADLMREHIESFRLAFLAALSTEPDGASAHQWLHPDKK